PASGKVVGQLTFGPAKRCDELGCGVWFTAPVASPNGKYVLYQLRYGVYPGNSERDAYELWRVNADGSNPRQVSQTLLAPPLFGSAAWTPDSKRFAYDAAGTIHVASADGSDDHVVGRISATRKLKWSPSGRRLLAVSVRASADGR